MESIYEDIAARTGGNLYVGVVGPVRTGKSTLIKRIMEQLVIPGISDPYRAERARDELPQCGSGKTIMTSEPKFVPEEAVEISPDGTSLLRVRMIDSVGYMVKGAAGATEDGSPRMVTTPWFNHEIPLTDAAELGTKKVMEEHCSVGLLVTTDGSVTDIPWEDYADAEKRAIQDMEATGKPFLILINTQDPDSAEAAAIQSRIRDTFSREAMIVNCQTLSPEEIGEIFRNLLYSFPMAAMQVHFPRWMEALEKENPLKTALYQALLNCAGEISSLGQAEEAVTQLKELEILKSAEISALDPATGIVKCSVEFPRELFYRVLSSKAGTTIDSEGQLLDILENLSQIREEYSRLSDALASVRSTGYGIVMPAPEEMNLQPPEIVRKGSTYGVKLKADASAIHMIRVDVNSEISPMVGGEQQSRELMDFLTGEDPDALWESNIFGKSVHTLIQEGFTAKLSRTPDEVKEKFRNSLTRIVNEGASGLICLIL